MKVYIGVGGRFHADRMGEALLSNHEVSLFTSYPGSRFPQIPSNRIHSFLLPEVGYRALKGVGFEIPGEHLKMQAFGRAFAAAVVQQPIPEVLIGWSSFALEALKLSKAAHKIVVRDSAHIRFQSEILRDEYESLGIRYPNKDFGVQRELEEYQLADTIFVLSEFAKRTFGERGVPLDKIKVIRLGVNTSLFQPKDPVVPKLPLKAIYFGAISVQKGVHYLLEATKDIPKSALELTLVGSISPEFRPILKKYSHALIKRPMAHPSLSQFLRTQDTFIFPTIHDGFGQTLIQAMASGLVPICTSHCGAAEIIRQNQSGFVIPARDLLALRQNIHYLIDHLKDFPQVSAEATKVRASHSWGTYSLEVAQAVENAARPSFSSSPKVGLAK